MWDDMTWFDYLFLGVECSVFLFGIYVSIRLFLARLFPYEPPVVHHRSTDRPESEWMND